MFLVQRTVGIEDEYRHVMQLVFCFLDGLRIVGRADRFAYGNLPAQGYGKRSILPCVSSSRPMPVQDTAKAAHPSRHKPTAQRPVLPIKLFVFIISYLIYKIIQNRNLIS